MPSIDSTCYVHLKFKLSAIAWFRGIDTTVYRLDRVMPVCRVPATWKTHRKMFPCYISTTRFSILPVFCFLRMRSFARSLPGSRKVVVFFMYISDRLHTHFLTNYMLKIRFLLFPCASGPLLSLFRVSIHTSFLMLPQMHSAPIYSFTVFRCFAVSLLFFFFKHSWASRSEWSESASFVLLFGLLKRFIEQNSFEFLTS